MLPAAEGMATVLPAVWCTSAEAELPKYAHMATEVRPGLSTQAVVMPVVVLPALAAVFGARLKFTVLPLFTVTVSDSESVAFSVTVPVFELIWALTGGTLAATRNRAAPAIHNLCEKRILIFSFKESFV